MQPSQASIYRATERLLHFAIGVAERLPKSLPYKVLGERMIVEIMECLDCIVLAFQVKKGSARLEFINALIMRMTSVNTTFRAFVENRNSQLSQKQHEEFLRLITAISTQAGAWRSKNTMDAQNV